MPREFYDPKLTTLSERVLDGLLGAVSDLILIGGWATFFRVGGARSHDIDVVASPHLLSALAEHCGEITRSTHLGGAKYRAEVDGIHVDIYVPYQSTLGLRLKLPVAALPPYAETIHGHRVLASHAHLATKIAALLDRPDSLPGEKDRDEIHAILVRERPSPSDVVQVLQRSPLTDDELARAVDDVFVYLGDREQLSRPDRQSLRSLAASYRDALEPRLMEPDDELLR